MEILTVGKPYIAGITSYPQEGADFNFRCGQYELRLFYHSLTNLEAYDIAAGTVQFKLAVVDSVIFLLAQFGEQPWIDASFSIHLVPEDERTLPPAESLTGEIHAMLAVILIDCDTGIVNALRAVTFGKQFTAALGKAIVKQAGQPFDRVVHDAWIDLVYKQCTSNAIAEQLAIVACVGGEDD